MLTIGRLRLTLPAGYAARAARIARLVADELPGRLPASSGDLRGDLRLDHLALPSVQVAPGATDRQVAGAVAAALVSSLSGLPGAGKGTP